MLKFYDVTKIYNKKTIALNRFNMHVQQGSIHALLGHNGAGKTTAFMVANKFTPFNHGKIFLKGKEISNIGKKEMKKIGLITDKFKLYEDLTVKETLLFFINIYGIRPQKKVLNSIIEDFELSEFINKKIKNLSTGMYKKTIIAISLIGDPEIVFLDEPFAGVDPVMLKKISHLIKFYNQQKKTTFIISSHNLSEIEQVANYVTIIKSGSTILSDSLETLFQKYKIEKSFKINYLLNGNTQDVSVLSEEELINTLHHLEKLGAKILIINENKISLNDIYNRIYTT